MTASARRRSTRPGASGTDAGGRYLSPEASGAYTATVTDRMLLEVAVTTGLRWGEMTLRYRSATSDGVEPCLRVLHAQDNSPLPIFEFTGQPPSRVSPSRPRVPARRQSLACRSRHRRGEPNA